MVAIKRPTTPRYKIFAHYYTHVGQLGIVRSSPYRALSNAFVCIEGRRRDMRGAYTLIVEKNQMLGNVIKADMVFWIAYWTEYQPATPA